MTEHHREAPRAPEPRLSGSRPLTFGLLVLGGLLAVVATAQPWWRAQGEGARVSFKGTEATGGLSQALAVVALAGTLLVLVLRARGRQVVGALLALVALAVVLVGALRLRPTGAAVRTKIREVSLIDSYALSPTAWPWLFALGGLALLGGAGLLLVGSPRWPVRADRFERQAADSEAVVTDDPAQVWKALDAGLDPTVGADPEPASGADGPDVQIVGAGDTMDEKNQPDRSARTARPSPVSD